ncbi:MAG: hypothetical protein LBI39_00640 [Puniceicoccales bacterium]|jgi:hypothetical protein|nr:hypothetical protein [Puniceicoccales bacterium]
MEVRSGASQSGHSAAHFTAPIIGKKIIETATDILKMAAGGSTAGAKVDGNSGKTLGQQLYEQLDKISRFSAIRLAMANCEMSLFHRLTSSLGILILGLKEPAKAAIVDCVSHAQILDEFPDKDSLSKITAILNRPGSVNFDDFFKLAGKDFGTISDDEKTAIRKWATDNLCPFYGIRVGQNDFLTNCLHVTEDTTTTSIAEMKSTLTLSANGAKAVALLLGQTTGALAAIRMSHVAGSDTIFQTEITCLKGLHSSGDISVAAGHFLPCTLSVNCLDRGPHTHSVSSDYTKAAFDYFKPAEEYAAECGEKNIFAQQTGSGPNEHVQHQVTSNLGLSQKNIFSPTGREGLDEQPSLRR